MQLMPGTAADIGVDPNDPRQNAIGGVDYLAEMFKKYGNKVYATAAYNAGPGRFDKFLDPNVHAPLPDETIHYIGKVLPDALARVVDMDGGSGGGGGGRGIGSAPQIDTSYVDREQADLQSISSRKNAELNPINEQVIRNNNILQEQLDEFSKQAKETELPKDYKFNVPPPQTDVAQAFGSAASIFAVVASAFTHTPAISAMNALAGVVKAQKAGDRQAYEDQFNQFEENTKLALERHKQASNEMNEAIKMMSTNIASGAAMANMVASKYEDEKHLAEIRAGRYEKISEMQLSAQKSSEQMQINFLKMQQQKEEFDNKLRAAQEESDKKIAAAAEASDKRIAAAEKNLDSRLKTTRDLTHDKIASGEKIAGERIASTDANTDKRIASGEKIAGERLAATYIENDAKMRSQSEQQRLRLEAQAANADKRYIHTDAQNDAKMQFEIVMQDRKTKDQAYLLDKKLEAAKSKGAFGNPTAVEYRDPNGVLRSTQAIWDKSTQTWRNVEGSRGANGELPELHNVVNTLRAGDDATPEEKSALVDAIGQYKHAPFTGYAAGMGQNQAIMSEVYKKYPKYSEQFWQSSQKAYNDFFGDGKITQSIRQINASVSHIGMLNRAIDALKNGDQKTLNAVGNQLAVELNLSTAPTDFDTIKSVVTDEISKFIVGGTTAEGTRERYNTLFDKNLSGEQLHSNVNKLYGLMAGQLEPIGNQYKRDTFRNDFFDSATGFLDPEVKQVLGFNDDGTRKPDSPGMESPKTRAYPTGFPQSGSGKRDDPFIVHEGDKSAFEKIPQGGYYTLPGSKFLYQKGQNAR
jgi:hypothetical protein